MKTLFSYILTPIYYLFFGLGLLFFHVVQWLGYNLFGYKGHKWAVDRMNRYLMSCLYILGTKITFIHPHSLPKDAPLILVSNHQSMYDISPLAWFLRTLHPKFVAKKELEKGIPSISYNLNHGGSVLIDRRDARQSLTALAKFGKFIKKNNYAAVIFPEGTRSIDGSPKAFSSNGLKMLVKYAPGAYVVPVSINNCWKITQYGKFPLGVGAHISFEIHEAIKVDSMPFKDLFTLTEKIVKEGIRY
ncbi:MAG: 1-acyl-sn-glycerol-3-phosphate acyltransferase [Flavobacteriaceae bacterium]|nr:MAG: 1-acyl-sn-glycerol-3-phosphate acyltransferase [Flavobacteriaceae bacterium]